MSQDKIHVEITEGDKLLMKADWRLSEKASMHGWISRWLKYHTDTYTATMTFPDGKVKIRGKKPEPVAVPDIPAPTSPEVLAYRELASLLPDQHATLWVLRGEVEVVVVENHAGDDSDITKAYATCWERHTHAEVVIRATHLVSRRYTIQPRWHDDQA